MLTTSTGFQNPADKMCASCNVWERSDSKGGNQYVTVCYRFTLYFAHFSICGYRLLVFSIAPVLYWKKTFPFMIFTFFSTKKPLVSTSFPLFCLIFHQKISVSHHFCISFVAPKAPKRAPKHQFCGSKGFQLTDPPFGKLETLGCKTAFFCSFSARIS